MCLQYRFSQSTDRLIYPQSVCVSVYELIELLSFFPKRGLVVCGLFCFWGFLSIPYERWIDGRTDRRTDRCGWWWVYLWPSNWLMLWLLQRMVGHLSEATIWCLFRHIVAPCDIDIFLHIVVSRQPRHACAVVVGCFFKTKTIDSMRRSPFHFLLLFLVSWWCTCLYFSISPRCRPHVWSPNQIEDLGNIL